MDYDDLDFPSQVLDWTLRSTSNNNKEAQQDDTEFSEDSSTEDDASESLDNEPLTKRLRS